MLLLMLVLWPYDTLVAEGLTQTVNNNKYHDNQSSLFASTTMDGAGTSGAGISLSTPFDNNQQSSQTDRTDVKVGVLLLNLGGPKSSDDVEGTTNLKVTNEVLCSC